MYITESNKERKMDKWLITYQDLQSKKKSVIEAQTKNEAMDKGRKSKGYRWIPEHGRANYPYK